jgi:hypothetical protein
MLYVSQIRSKKPDLAGEYLVILLSVLVSSIFTINSSREA